MAGAGGKSKADRVGTQERSGILCLSFLGMHRVDNGDQGSLGMKRQCAKELIVQSKRDLVATISIMETGKQSGSLPWDTSLIFSWLPSLARSYAVV